MSLNCFRDSSVDMSPFVRKTAAHAIPKLHSLDPEQKEELVTIIEKLLGKNHGFQFVKTFIFKDF